MPKKAVTSEVRRSLINVRTTADIRRRLEEAAASSGRSLTHEIEHRLEQTFAEDYMRQIAREEAQRLLAEHDMRYVRLVSDLTKPVEDALRAADKAA